MKTVLMHLAFPINTRQNANQKLIGSAPAYLVQYTLSPANLPDPPFRFFEGLVLRLISPPN